MMDEKHQEIGPESAAPRHIPQHDRSPRMSAPDQVAAAWQSCYTCRDYARERREAIAAPLAEKARREGREVVAVVDGFMLAAHARHVASGEPLRPGGPTRVTDPVAGRILATYAMLGARATRSCLPSLGESCGNCHRCTPLSEGRA